ncbi:SCP2 sterol-binding domain-containing protein [Endozoicomonas elysicola]|uniref:SCP-2 family sterol carrier protein n=1 Tax=Endozoicomonas elysicola TaxID=305900 RepID=A0A081K8V5_9GAMM|nr:SCP2 sterol-binding domain-containing protein [Endozoicomonas elysicola]KEI70581.1 SCP-2 family sterol carrier protein [Endozoicomonas elysicola]
MATVQEVLENIKGRFDESAAAGQTLTFQFDLTDDKAYYAAIEDGVLEIAEGTKDDAHVTLIMDSETFVGLMSGELDGMQAFMTGKLRTEGNMMLASKLGEFFKQ